MSGRIPFISQSMNQALLMSLESAIFYDPSQTQSTPHMACLADAIGKIALFNCTLNLIEVLEETGGCVSFVTIVARIELGIRFAPGTIGQVLLGYFSSPAAEFQPELIFRGA